ncbi:MAG: ABC transporter ATP-binding protein/permease [Solobacterium sp.]|nr:ABC transporter ATP-binding protein/permease [Solobacterium sp.]
MLELKDIKKDYKTGNGTVHALKGISVQFRENEFVSILGPSGCGKTTMLNIIGGLDSYTSGDLIINGKSTRQYTDRDWDTYRNHTIGFVFQSYNLIPHQTVLQNVELALTLSGVSPKERRQRALEALEQVGLKDQTDKRPSQMSGGQMQRVAIARALVNNPDILLADEPTGALDSETSIQVMDLLKEVAKDRLVIMVTHNPELAEEYATRIIRFKDGILVSDSDPYNASEVIPDTGALRRASMSFLTALSLSFNNLRTKLTRTLLVSFAGSIGIIGIALILSLSNGVNLYIKNIEEETLSEYPMMIQSMAFDLSSFLEGRGSSDEEEEKQEGDVKERQIAGSMFSSTTANDLVSLKEYFDGNDQIAQYAKSVEYSYSISPQIYSDFNNEIRQVNPSTTMSSMGFSVSSNSALMSSFNSSDVFYTLPREAGLYQSQYDVKAGHWPQNYNELVLVVSPFGSITDITLYTLGLKDSAELDDMVTSFSQGKEVDMKPSHKVFNYEDFLGISFRLVNSADYYTYDSEYNVYADRTSDKAYMKKLVENGEELKIVGVVMAKEDASIAMLETGLHYPYELIEHIVRTAEDREIVQKQIVSITTDVITNKEFGVRDNEAAFDMSSLFAVDAEAMSQVFQFDPEGINIDFGAMNFDNIDLSDIDLSGINIKMPELNVADLLQKVKINISQEELESAFNTLISDYLEYASNDPATDYQKLPEALEKYFRTDRAGSILRTHLQELMQESGASVVTPAQLEEIIVSVMSDFQAYAAENGMTDPEQISEYLSQYLSTPAAQAKILESVNTIVSGLSSFRVSEEELQAIGNELLEDYRQYAEAESYPQVSAFSDSFAEYMNTDSAKKILSDTVSKAVDTSELQEEITKTYSSYASTFTSEITKLMNRVSSKIMTTITSQLQNVLSRSMMSMMNAFHVDTDAFTRAIQFNMTEEQLSGLMSSMMSTERTTYETNLRILGYADSARPTVITIYPRDFESKAEITNMLSSYNDRMESSGQKEKVIRYTDVVGTMMTSVTDIINAISYVLIAFVAISLVVSSIMIGVITYISVLERNKEIGILRAIGASKRNISNVFNAETFIIGILAGVIGVGVSALLLIPGNQLIHSLTGRTDINAVLPIPAAVILVILSVILTMIGGIIPSRKAAKSDPVTALRTE